MNKSTPFRGQGGSYMTYPIWYETQTTSACQQNGMRLKLGIRLWWMIISWHVSTAPMLPMPDK